MGEILGHDIQAKPVRQPVGMQGNQGADGDTAHADQQPEAKDADAIVESGLHPPRRRLGEQIDGAAKQHRFGKGNCGQG